MMAEPFYGYRFDLERHEMLASSSMQFRYAVDGQYDAPDEIDPRGWHVIENQGSMGSCQGHALTSCCEYAYRIATAGEVKHFSEMFGYLSTQKVDGLLGRDQGSTIEGGAKAAKLYGNCPVEVFPYPSRYSTNVPHDAWSAAEPFKIKYHSMCTSYEDVYAFLASGQGGVEIGLQWNNSMTPNSHGIIEHYTSGGGGGHAVCFLGYSAKTDGAGNKYLWLANSWSASWGKEGWAQVAPVAVDQILRHRWSVAIGLSDLTTPEPRKVDWRQWEPVE
jgi:C1A family cysteine protease